MSRRGRPRITEREYRERALLAQTLMEEEERAASDGRGPLKKQTVFLVAVELGISERSVRRLLADYRYVPVDWSKTVLGAFLRQLRDRQSA
jgi:hypothetical protein